MTSPHPDPILEVPEADLLEQQTSVDPPAVTDPEAVIDAAADLPAGAETVEEADRLEQLGVVPGADEEDYPHET